MGNFMKKCIRNNGIIIFTLCYCLFSFCNLSLFFQQSSNFKRFTDNLKISSSNSQYWPISDWRTSSPESQGMDLGKLIEMEDYITERSIRERIDSLLIVKNGYLVYESYPSNCYDWNDMHHIFSCTKVFTSALIGVGIEEGYIAGVEDHLIDYFPNRSIDHLDSQKRAITLEHLLTMTSGLEWFDQIDYYIMAETSDWVQYVLDRPMQSIPGTEWNYNSGGSHLLSAILDQQTPNGTLDYAKVHIFNPLNITNYRWIEDTQGIPNGGTLLHLTPRDMAKFGFLYLYNGFWNNTQLIPSNWVAQSRSTIIEQSYDQGHGIGYGYKWWIYDWGYAARGSYEQNIVIIPDLNLVVVSTGNAEFDLTRLLADYIIPSADSNPLYILLILFIIISLSALCAVSTIILYRKSKKKTK
jgi:CubicO group peptidase (beta-lactamase class C family)